MTLWIDARVGALAGALLALLALAGAGCGSSTAAAPPPVAADPAGFKLELDHPFVPTTPGVTWVLAGTHDDAPRLERVEALPDTVRILGIPCTAVRQTIHVAGELMEITTEWLAQDLQGNVWKFGEESLERHADGMHRSDDSWVGGEAGARPWLTFAAQPAVGDVYAGYRPGGEDSMHVVSLAATADVPAGRYEGCMEIVENPDDPDDKDIILYAPGVGRVAEDSSSGRIELVAVERR